MGADRQCVARLAKELKALSKEPPTGVLAARPSDEDQLTWHFLVQGPQGTDYSQGVFHGKLVFPSAYPFKPPAIMVLTPNGRFATGTRLCLSMSDFHPESWNPLWSVGSILQGLRSFWAEDSQAVGTLRSSAAARQRLARMSCAHNAASATLRRALPEVIEAQRHEAERRAQEDGTPCTAEAAGDTGAGGGGEAQRAPPAAMVLLLLVGVAAFAALALPLLQAAAREADEAPGELR